MSSNPKRPLAPKTAGVDIETSQEMPFEEFSAMERRIQLEGGANHDMQLPDGRTITEAQAQSREAYEGVEDAARRDEIIDTSSPTPARVVVVTSQDGATFAGSVPDTSNSPVALNTTVDASTRSEPSGTTVTAKSESISAIGMVNALGQPPIT